MLFHKKYIISYKTKFRKVLLSETGGKGFNLFRLYYNGSNVPEWFIISTSFFNKVILPFKAGIKDLIEEINFLEPESIERAAAGIKSLINDIEYPDIFVKQLRAEFNNIIGESNYASVRSSVADEDSNDNSFAGQMNTYLHVPYKNILTAIKDVWASAFSGNVLLYRYKKNLSLFEISAAVIIQRMVSSYSSGILFTKDPENNKNEFVISAGFGLGDGIVQGLIKTDTYKANKTTKVIKKIISEKDLRTISDDEKGTDLKDLPQDMKLRHVLNDKQIHNLLKEAEKIENIYERPMDIEWAFDENETLYILQARPIVKPVRAENVFILDNSNIAESYPGLTLPLTFSFVLNGYENHFRNATLGLLLNKKEIAKDLHIFKNMLCLYNGTVYYNLTSWYRMLSYLPGFKKYKKTWEQMIGIRHEYEFPENKLCLYNKIYSTFKLIRILLTFNMNANKFYRYFDPVYKSFKDIDYSRKSADEIIKLYCSLEKELLPRWYYTLYNDICAMKYYNWLKELCDKWGLAGMENKLLSGEKNIDSVDVIRSLMKIAEFVKKNKLYNSLFDVENDNSILSSIQGEPIYTELNKMIAAYIKDYGDRAPEELKLENRAYREDPVQIISLLKTYIKCGITSGTFSNNINDVRRESEKKVKCIIRNPFKYILFGFVLNNARHAIRNRENMRFARSRLFGLVRQMFRRIASEYRSCGIIDHEEDLYYLTYEEVFNYMRGTSYNKDLKQLISIRKTEYKGYSKLKTKDRIILRGSPYTSTASEISLDTKLNGCLKGIGCSYGKARANAKVTLTAVNKNFKGNYILVARTTDPGWVFLMSSSKGVIAEKGSLLSHTAIICRELGIPSIVNVENATTLIRDNSLIEIDGETGVVKCL